MNMSKAQRKTQSSAVATAQHAPTDMLLRAARGKGSAARVARDEIERRRLNYLCAVALRKHHAHWEPYTNR